jgi:3'-5' exoribonuclease
VLVRAVLSDDVLDRFCRWPAAQQRHGAVRHGLLAHSLSVVCIATQLGETYGPDGLKHDRDIVIAASLLHDVGKIYTLPAVAGAPLPEGATECDHVTRSVLMVQDAARAQSLLPPERLGKLTHAILGHHGRKEWGAAVEPQSAEAWLVHLADLAESRLWDWSNEEARP